LPAAAWQAERAVDRPQGPAVAVVTSRQEEGPCPT
jgi:hypothetical protein